MKEQSKQDHGVLVSSIPPVDQNQAAARNLREALRKSFDLRLFQTLFRDRNELRKSESLTVLIKEYPCLKEPDTLIEELALFAGKSRTQLLQTWSVILNLLKERFQEFDIPSLWKGIWKTKSQSRPSVFQVEVWIILLNRFDLSTKSERKERNSKKYPV